MTPIAYFFTHEKTEARYKKKKDKITREQAIRWVAEDIAKYLVTRNRNEEMSFMVAEFFNEDYFSGYFSLSYIDRRLLKRNKTWIGYYKLNKDVDTQKEIMDCLSNMKGIKVRKEIQTFKWQQPRNYQGTYHISYKG
jgi:hypothetical protein